MEFRFQFSNSQLQKVNEAIVLCTEDAEREKLVNLRADLTELLQLTQQTIDDDDAADAADVINVLPSCPVSAPPATQADEDAEFMRFMQEIRQADEDIASGANVDVCDAEEMTATAAVELEMTYRSYAQIKIKLTGLIGQKCSAPHMHAWGSQTYHNAMVCGLDDRTDYEASALQDERSVCVKVLFTHPTHREMVPCSHYLDGECRFDSDECRFSHGELVPYGELRDYREPDFGRLQRRRRWPVLVKQTDRMWHSAVAMGCDVERQTCRLRLDGGGRRELDVDYADVLPMYANADESGDDSDDEEANASPEDDHSNRHVNDEHGNDPDDSDHDDEAERRHNTAMHRSALVERSLLTTAPDRPLGEWEKHTKGFGSRMMQKYGYVLGTGLGHDGGGIVVPISAQVLPAGRSLDHCMALREQANGDQNLFSVERRLKEQQNRQEKRNVKAYDREARRTSSAGDVFSFMNESVLGGSGGGGGSAGRTGGATVAASSSGGRAGQTNKECYKEHSTKNLNVAGFQLGEDIRRKELDMQKVESFMGRHAVGSTMHNRLKGQLDERRRELDGLKRSESIVQREQSSRKDKNKLTVF